MSARVSTANLTRGSQVWRRAVEQGCALVARRTRRHGTSTASPTGSRRVIPRLTDAQPRAHGPRPIATSRREISLGADRVLHRHFSSVPIAHVGSTICATRASRWRSPRERTRRRSRHEWATARSLSRSTATAICSPSSTSHWRQRSTPAFGRHAIRDRFDVCASRVSRPSTCARVLRWVPTSCRVRQRLPCPQPALLGHHPWCTI